MGSIRVPRDQEPLLNIVSHGRKAPGQRPVFTKAQVNRIAHTVRRAPEVMVKVTGGGTSRSAVRAHLQYIGRDGERPVETDDAERIDSTASADRVLADWDLDLVNGQYRGGTSGRKAKLVYNIALGMPSPTPPDKVLRAAQQFAREQFAVTHRYALVLHTDQKHPHVHLVVKAESENGKRLRIDKATLRQWRDDFAQHMRDQGVAANASSRFERGLARRSFKANEYRAVAGRTSRRVLATLNELDREWKQTGTFAPDPAQVKLARTRQSVQERWNAVAEILDAQGETALAADTRQFAKTLPVVRTIRERMAESYLALRNRNRHPPDPREQFRSPAPSRTGPARDDEYSR